MLLSPPKRYVIWTRIKAKKRVLIEPSSIVVSMRPKLRFPARWSCASGEPHIAHEYAPVHVIATTAIRNTLKIISESMPKLNTEKYSLKIGSADDKRKAKRITIGAVIAIPRTTCAAFFSSRYFFPLDSTSPSVVKRGSMNLNGGKRSLR